MATLEEHCADCRHQLGEDFREVHIWLDELFGRLGPKHRDARHHSGGVEQVRQRWGDKAARAAEIHIRKDCGGKLPAEGQAQLLGLFGPEAITQEKGKQ
ncbi:MAG: hypothetical protein JXB13_15450 [Phycisphaerae bacterium]|nr:hypothetical protein [Phycisphaerae bacterium]